MTTTTRPNPVLAPADDVPAPPPSTPEKKRHWLVPVVVGAVAFGAGVGVGSKLSWRLSAWWKPT
ncbi:hypothetical protein GCM10022399_27870 [Terrabacter ginsenosidimutans]|jgi:hypothetical protein|uniref:Uncharacterized protein n=1 Tax=Terrabacter ginsenosidimutans TaxID=490575 RepID=A0ABP7DTZ5_9MICO